MKKFFDLVVVCLFLLSPLTSLAKDTYVQGYYRQNGTYVQPHHRSAPDGNVHNNWSTKGNVNPYTGQMGTHNPHSSYGNSSPRQGNPYGGSGSLLNNGYQGFGGF